MVHPIRVFNLTSLHYSEGQHIHPKRELGASNDGKSSCNANVFLRNGVDSGRKISTRGSRANKKAPQPEGQHHLCEEGANNEHKDDVPHAVVASIFTRT